MVGFYVIGRGREWILMGYWLCAQHFTCIILCNTTNLQGKYLLVNEKALQASEKESDWPRFVGGEQKIWELNQHLSESAHTFLLATIAFRILAPLGRIRKPLFFLLKWFHCDSFISCTSLCLWDVDTFGFLYSH